jgi:hypothetical protein
MPFYKGKNGVILPNKSTLTYFFLICLAYYVFPSPNLERSHLNKLILHQVPACFRRRSRWKVAGTRYVILPTAPFPAKSYVRPEGALLKKAHAQV